MEEKQIKGLGVYERQHLETKTRILEASKELALEEGFSSVTMAEIAAKAGISRQRLYSYFANLDEIYYEIQILDMKGLVAFMQSELNIPNESPKEKLALLINKIFDYGELHPEDFIFTNGFDAYYLSRRVSPSLRTRYFHTYGNQDLTSSLNAIIRDGQTKGQFRLGFEASTASTFWTNTLQLTLERIAFFTHNGEGHSKEELETFKRTFVEAIFRYLKP